MGIPFDQHTDKRNNISIYFILYNRCAYLYSIIDKACNSSELINPTGYLRALSQAHMNVCHKNSEFGREMV